MINAQNNYSQARAQLNAAMGVEGPVDFDVADQSLGPARGQFGDPLTIWPDKIAVNRLVQVAEDAADTDGTAFITEVLANGGVLVDGVAPTEDVRGADFPVGGPQLLVAKSIAITQ